MKNNIKWYRIADNQMKYEKFKLFVYHLSNGYTILPFQFTANISNICNRKCKFCPNWGDELQPSHYLTWMKKQPDLMDFNKFEDMLKRMGILRKFIRQFSMTGRGDPGLHPDLLKMCETLNNYKIPYSITSNGDYFDDAFFHELAKFNDYCKWVRVSLFNVEKAKYWLAMQEKHKVNIAFINETGYHLEGYEDGYVTANNKGNEKYATMPLNFVEESYCRAPFSFYSINTDGSIVPCITCFEIGNAFEEPFWKILNSKKARWIRKQALKMEVPKDFADCKNCGYFMSLPKYRAMNKYRKIGKGNHETA